MTSKTTIKTFGEPGGIYFELHFDHDRATYFAVNEAGDEVCADPFETVVREYIEDATTAEQAAAGGHV